MNKKNLQKNLKISSFSIFRIAQIGAVTWHTLGTEVRQLRVQDDRIQQSVEYLSNKGNHHQFIDGKNPEEYTVRVFVTPSGVRRVFKILNKKSNKYSTVCCEVRIPSQNLATKCQPTKNSFFVWQRRQWAHFAQRPRFVLFFAQSPRESTRPICSYYLVR